MDDGKSAVRPVNVAAVKQRLARMRRWRLAEYEKMMITGFVRSCPVCGYSGEFVPNEFFHARGGPARIALRRAFPGQPLKLFLPISLAFFLTGFGYYAYTFLSSGRFTNMSALLFITSVLVFLIGLVSEQITALMYREPED